MAIEFVKNDRKKKKVKNNKAQRLAGGQATGGGDSVNNAGNTGVIDTIVNTRIPIQSGGSRGSLGDFAEGNPEGAIGSLLNTRIPIQSGGSRGSLETLGNTPQVSTDPSTPISQSVTQPIIQEPSLDSAAKRQIELAGTGTTATPTSDQLTAIDQSNAANVTRVGDGVVNFGDTSNPNSVDYGSPEANAAAAERFRTGGTRGSFNVIGSKDILDASRLTNARSAVSKLKAGGASASAQLEAFRRISKGGEVDRKQKLAEQFQDATTSGNKLGAREISRSIDRHEVAQQGIVESKARVEGNELGAVSDAQKTQDTLAKEASKYDSETNSLLRNLVKVDPVTAKPLHDVATRSDQITRRFKDKDISANLFQSLYPDFFKGGLNTESLDTFRARTDISDDLKLKARDALIAQQSRR